jgi:hypothetical protein
MKKHLNVFWEGRFQPIHRGHIAYIQTILEYSERVWIYIVDNEISTEVNCTSPVPSFTKEVDTHHIKEKNPLPFWLRLLIVQETIKSELGFDVPVTVWGGRRFDLMWDYFSKKALPYPRIFVIPTRDSFEDSKAAAWQSLGETVERIDVSHLPKVSATMVRNAILNGQNLDSFLCKKTIEILFKYDAFKFLTSPFITLQT